MLSEADLCVLASARTPGEVYELSVKSKDLVSLPESLNSFKKLRALDCSANRLGRVDIALLQSLPDLRELRLSSNALTIMPDMRYNTKLENLYLENNKIRALSNGLLKCAQLKTLWVSYNAIEGKFDAHILPGALRNLDLSHNKLSNLTIRKLTKLESLLLNDNELSDAPDISRCKLLDELDLSRNGLSRCDTLGNQQSLAKHSLSVLRLNENEFTRLRDIPRLSALSELELAGNKLTSVKDIAKNFPALEVLDLSDNQLGELNDTIEVLAELEFLVELTLSGNPCVEAVSNVSVYRQMVCSRLTGLEFLDSTAVADKDRSLQQAPFESSTALPVDRKVPQQRPQSARAGGRVPLVRPSTAKGRVDADARLLEKRIESLLKERTESINNTKHKFDQVLNDCYSVLKELGGGGKSNTGNRTPRKQQPKNQQQQQRTPPPPQQQQRRVRPQSARRPSSAHSKRSRLTAAKQFSTIVYREGEQDSVQALPRGSPSPPLRASPNPKKKMMRSSSQTTVKRTQAADTSTTSLSSRSPRQQKSVVPPSSQQPTNPIERKLQLSARRVASNASKPSASARNRVPAKVPKLLLRAQNYDSSSGSSGGSEQEEEEEDSQKQREAVVRPVQRQSLYGITRASSDEDEDEPQEQEQEQTRRHTSPAATDLQHQQQDEEQQHTSPPVVAAIDLRAAVQHQQEEAAAEEEGQQVPVETEEEHARKIEQALHKVQGDAVMFARPSSARRSARSRNPPISASSSSSSSFRTTATTTTRRSQQPATESKVLNTAKVSIRSRVTATKQTQPSIRRTGGNAAKTNPFLKKKKKTNVH